MSADKVTIGITPRNEEVMERIMATGLFRDKLDAAKFAMSVAVSKGIYGSAEGANTNWNVGSVDPDGDLRAVLAVLHPDAEHPFRLIECLMNAGLAHLEEQMSSVSEFDILSALEG